MHTPTVTAILERIISHISGTRNSGYLLMCCSLLFPFGYLIVTSIDQTFHAAFFWKALAATSLLGIGLWIFIVICDYHLTERLKKRLTSLDLIKLLDGDLQLIDRYNGWSREIKIEGSFRNRKIFIDHRFEKGNFGNVPYLTFAIAPSNRTILEFKVDKHLTVDEIDMKIRNLLAANEGYKSLPGSVLM